jgi:AcrR family transcriptional regulator
MNMNENVKKRRYRSPLREHQALETKAAILDAAQELFVEDGYGATSIRAIAGKAGVSEATVYASFGQKASILWAALLRAVIGDEEDDTSTIPQKLARSVRQAEGIIERTRLILRWSRQHWERGAADLEVAMERAVDTDPELTEMAERAAEGRLEAVRQGLTLALEAGSLRDGLADEDVVDLIWAIDSPQVYRSLVRGRGWSPDKYERWMGEIITRAFLLIER